MSELEQEQLQYTEVLHQLNLFEKNWDAALQQHVADEKSEPGSLVAGADSACGVTTGMDELAKMDDGHDHIHVEKDSAEAEQANYNLSVLPSYVESGMDAEHVQVHGQDIDPQVFAMNANCFDFKSCKQQFYFGMPASPLPPCLQQSSVPTAGGSRPESARAGLSQFITSSPAAPMVGPDLATMVGSHANAENAGHLAFLASSMVLMFLLLVIPFWAWSSYP